MVLRALLMRHEGELKLFGRSARRPGFAQEISALLAELHQHQFPPARLRALAGRENLRRELRGKLADLALLSENYSRWLAEHELQDANRLLDVATESLKSTVHSPQSSDHPGALQSSILHPPSSLQISSLWLDGFAEMTPQELDLLAAILPFCDRATLAFCIESTPDAEPERLSIWSAIARTFQQCRRRIENIPGCKIEVEILSRDTSKNRFA